MLSLAATGTRQAEPLPAVPARLRFVELRAAAHALAPGELSARSAMTRALRILHVIPGDPGGGAMIFAKRQVASLARAGATCETIYLSSRTDPCVVARYGRLIRRLARRFQPDVI